MRVKIRAQVMDDNGKPVCIVDGETSYNDLNKPSGVSCFVSSFGSDDAGKKRAKDSIKGLCNKALWEMYNKKRKT